MLGDILPSNTNPNTDGVSDPASRLKSGYGSADSGAAKPVTPSPAPAVTEAPRSSSSRISFVLTIVGIIVFVGGVSGLFMYAMSS